ncbi:MAG: response regulator [Candidatus Binatia bacterium]|nr:response regulator [Candidatus Binatia bacterium]
MAGSRVQPKALEADQQVRGNASVLSPANSRTVGEPRVPTALGLLAQSTEEEVAASLARLARMPYVDSCDITVDPQLAQHLKVELAHRYGCVPLAACARVLRVAATHPLDSETRHVLEFAAHRPVEVAIAPQADVHAAQLRLYEGDRLLAWYMKRITSAASPVNNSAPTEAPACEHGDLSAGAKRLATLLLADASANAAAEVAVVSARGWTTVFHRSPSGWAPAFNLPGWVGAWLAGACSALNSSRQEGVTLTVAGRVWRWICELDENPAQRTLYLVLEPPEALAPTRFLPQGQTREFACPRCRTTALHRTTLCPNCKLPLWRLCRNCGGRFHASQPVCSCCGAAATPAPAAPTAAPLAPTGPLLRTRPVGAPPTQLHVLVVDDQPDVRHCMANAFRSLPVRVSLAASGEEALSFIAQDPPHMIVLDMVMPGIDGFEVIARLRASLRTAFVPIFAVTVLDPLDPRLRETLGPDDLCLQKPFSKSELLTRAARLARLTYGFKLTTATAAQGGEAITAAQTFCAEEEPC